MALRWACYKLQATFTNNGTLTGGGAVSNSGTFNNFGNATIIGLNNSGQLTNQASGELGLDGTSFNFGH